MMYTRLITKAAVLQALVQVCRCQDPTPTQTDPDVPTGTPIEGDYTGPLRPQIHFSPPEFFMNDPNGMFRDSNGTWHLYYQYNPTDYVAGNQHWGHATSQDLYHWENQPIALFPPEENVFIWSGSAIVDPDNTSGFFPDQDNGVVAIYTLHEEGGVQTQAVAYSRDGGYTFTPYEGNPVIPSTSNQFRDPKVIWYQDHWVMAVAYSTDFSIGIFTSPDLIDWTATSNFTLQGLIGLQYECPNLIQIPYIDAQTGEKQNDMWLMYISISPGAPLGGSIGQYFPGTFNGTHFEAVDAVTRIADFGKDNYASQWFYGLAEDELPVSIAWSSNWQYASEVPTGDELFRSSMSLPRQNYLTRIERVGWKLVSELYDPSPVLGETLESKDDFGNGNLSLDFSGVDSNAVLLQINTTNVPTSGRLTFTFKTSNTGESIRGGFRFGGDTTVFVDRGGASAFSDNPFFTDKFSVTTFPRRSSGDVAWSSTVVMDRSMLEVFVDGGVESATNTFFAEEPLTLLDIVTEGVAEDVGMSIHVKAITSAWAES